MKPIEPGCLVLVHTPDGEIFKTATIGGRWPVPAACICGAIDRYWDLFPDDGRCYCQCVLTRIDGHDEETEKAEDLVISLTGT